jgi:hypothetical protein
MKEKKLSFPFIYFLESGLFKGLLPIQIKKFPLTTGRSKCLTLSFGHTPARRTI